MTKTSRTLSKKDDVSHNESLALIKHYRPEDISPLILPKQLLEERRLICGMCGKPFEKLPTMLYFDEKFHVKCIIAAKHGDKV